jgi:hypothetical protein
VRDDGGIPVNLWQFTIVSVLITSEPSSSAWLGMHWTLILPNKNLGRMLFNIIIFREIPIFISIGNIC